MSTGVSAEVIADSVSDNGDRLTTLQVTMHRFVLAEFNTHRKFSRNSASSRAIPVAKRLDQLTAEPIEWPSERPGMQGGAPLERPASDDAHELWMAVRDCTEMLVSNYLDTHEEPETRLHKSVLNRLLEPFLMHTVVVTSTEWENFFHQRVSPLAQPEIRVAAEAMLKAITESEPRHIRDDGWHTPYVSVEERSVADMPWDVACAVSAARCARVSYLTQEGVRDHEEDLKLYRRLISADPPHASPLEHVARPVPPHEFGSIIPPGNFDGWSQLRHIVMSGRDAAE